MDYKSSQSQGYEPKFSGPNHNYYMGASTGLLNMLQGGQPDSSGAAIFRQALQKQKDQKRLASIERQEAKRQKKGGFWGSVLGFGGSLLGGAIGGSAGAAIGKSLGTGIGQSLGAGKANKYSTKGTVYNQDNFRDVTQASKDYSSGILERSAVAGLQQAAGTYLSGGWKGAPTKGVAGSGSLGLEAPPTLGSSDPFASPGLFSDAGGSFSGANSGFSLTSPPSNLTMPDLLDYNVSNPIGSATSSGAGGSLFSGGSPSTGYNTMLDGYYQGGGLIGMSNGGFTAAGVLGAQGLDPTEQQLKLFQSFDPSKIEQAKTGAEASIFSMTGGMGLSSAGGGFGAKQRATASAIGAGEDLIGDTTEQAQRSFESDTLGTAADLVAGGANFKNQTTPDDPIYGSFNAPPIDDPAWSPPSSPTATAEYEFNGETWIWDGNHWVSGEQYQSDMDDYYDTQD